MKHSLLFTVCFAALNIPVIAQDDADYQKWMKTIGATSGSLRKNLDAKDGAAVAAAAKKLREAFDQVHDFWHKKGVDDAMKLAMTAGDGFREVAEQAAAAKFDDASTALKKASATCAACHSAHREKAADGSWKIK